MSDSEHSASDTERKSPAPRRAPINFDEVDDSADEAAQRVKEERDPTVRSRSRHDDESDDDAREDEDEIQPRREEKKPERRRDNDVDSQDEYDDEEEVRARERKRRVKKESNRYSDDEYGSDDNDDDVREDGGSGRKRKRVKTEGESRKKRRSSEYDDVNDEGRGGGGGGGAHDGYGDDADGDDDEDDGGSSRKRKPDTAMHRANEQIKALRRPRKKEVDTTAVENECIVFLERMMKARDDDLRAYRSGRPPLEKIKMLHEVEAMMTKVAHRVHLLDNMMLPVFKAWLDRLPDGALPNIEVRTTLLRILSDCRVDEDWLQRLEESQGLGKVIHFLSRSDDHEPNRRTAQKLMEKWARLVYRSNSNFHDLQDEFDKPEDGHKAGKDSVAAERKAALRTVRNFKTTQERMRAFKHREKQGKTELDMMASIPRATPFLFTTMAESSQDIDQRAVREMRQPKARTRRVNSTLANLRKANKNNSARAARPSLNGR